LATAFREEGLTLKVVLIHRKRRDGAYSIEEIFHTIASELRKYVGVVEYEAGTRWNIFKDIWHLRKLNADIYHVVGDVHYFIPLLPHGKTVLTVHDINHYLHDLVGLKRWVYKWVWLVLPIRFARYVTAISIETRGNIIKYFGSFGERIEVIENCHSVLLKHVARSFNIACPVILHLGTAPHKNVHRLIESLKGIRCQLVLIGPLDSALKDKLIEYGIDYVNRVNLTREEICQQYVDCDIVSFVSLAEGFGMPIIEAQASGRPLITSNVSPMCEVAGNGACLVDPLDVKQIRDGILRIIADSDYRDQLVEYGLLNTLRFSPVTISAQYLELYRRIV
jgi:glycosyltransferase involved in cell wall biosynthesis